MKTITLYTIGELRECSPKGYAKARATWTMDAAHLEIPSQNEIVDSLMSVCRACDVHVKNWAIGPHDSGAFIRCIFPRHEMETLQGRRAMAWLENNLLDPLRAPHGLMTLRRRNYYGHRASHIPPCPLTGTCFDEEYIEHLKISLRKGNNLKDAFAGLAVVASRLLALDLDNATSEDAFLNDCDFAGHLFTEYGQPVIV